MTWTGHTLQSSFRHGWQCFLGLAIGYIAIYTTNEFLLLMIQGATVFFLISMLVAAVFQRHAQYWSWLCHTGGNLLRRGWLLIVGIGLGYFFHTNTLVTLQLGGY